MKRTQPSLFVFILICLSVALLSGCAHKPLSLWNDAAPARNALVEYVNAVTDESLAQAALALHKIELLKKKYELIHITYAN